MVSDKLSKFGSSLLLVLTGALLPLSLFPGAASAQSQNDNTSVADAARRAREQKKNAPKPARTLTNDDLPAAPPAGQPSAAMPGGTQSAPDQANTESETGTSGKAPAVAETAAPAGNEQKKKAEIETALKRGKAELAQALSELDVLQRKSALDSDSFYSQTGFSQDTEGKAKLDEDAHLVNDKKSQVDELKSKVAALQAELGEAAEPDKPAQPQ